MPQIFGSITPAGPAAGDLTGSFPAPVIAGGAVTGEKIQRGASRAARIWDGLASPSALVGVMRVSASRYVLLQDVGENLLWGVRLEQRTWTGGTLHMLDYAHSYAPMVSADDSAATFTGAWVTGTNAGAYGGGYRHSNGLSGVTSQWTSPAGSTRLGIRVCQLANGGFAKVMVSGGQAANLLWTAQQWVDRGILDASALVANGGTLAPTDRLVESYGQALYDVSIGIADGLPAAAYTVTVTGTTYKRSAASGARTYVSGFTSATSATTKDTPGVSVLPMEELLDVYSSAYEYAIEWAPSGSPASKTFVGSVHGYEHQSSLAFQVDGSPVTLADGDVVWGAQVVATRVTALRHPSVGGGTTAIGDSTTTYTLTRGGLDVSWSITWTASGNGQMTRSYACMFPVNGYRFDRGMLDAGGRTFGLNGNSDRAFGQVKADLACVWSSSGRWAAALKLRDRVGVADYGSASGVDAWIQDRNPASLDFTKIYFTRVYDPAVEVTAAGGTLTGGGTYRCTPRTSGVEGVGSAGALTLASISPDTMALVKTDSTTPATTVADVLTQVRRLQAAILDLMGGQ